MIEQIIQKLKIDGYKVTKNRRAILESLLAAGKPLSVISLTADLESQGFSPNKTTVYRELYFLRDYGIVEESVWRDGSQYYEISDQKHKHHLICDDCGKVQAVELGGDLDQVEVKLSRKTAFQILKHDLTFYGLCARCK